MKPFVKILLLTPFLAFPNAADAETDDSDVLRAAAVNPYERKRADGLLKLGPAEMRKEYDGMNEEIQSRLDAWLSRGSLDTKLAASMSPKALLVHLAKSGIHHDASVASTYGMLRDFSHIYRDQLRLQNEQDFPQAGSLARSIRDAFNAANEFLTEMCKERSYHSDTIWGQSEWLLHQAKPGFAATRAEQPACSAVLWQTLRSELANCRDREGRAVGQEELSRPGEAGKARHERLEACLKDIRQALTPWTTEGQNYLLTELILLTRDRDLYLYGDVFGVKEGPRAISLIHTRQGPMRKEEWSTGLSEQRIGQVMVTLSSGHRETWDADPSCAMPQINWGDVAWIKNVRREDTPANANQCLRVVCAKGDCEIKPRGGWIQDFSSYFAEGVSIASIDSKGETWIEHYDFKQKSITESYQKSGPKPNPFPGWAINLWR